jgi:hypothetical protein
MQSARMVRGVSQRGCQDIEPLTRISGLCPMKIHVMLGAFGGQVALWPLQVPHSNRVGPMSEFGEPLLGMLV